ncbi:hypothetical protein AAZX31_13G042700 [Glycine max]|uniref:BHLH domain-containing protein n=2 Tax=Glycine subgen. Soja TaxID=1462606 RepID=I1LWS0_SOYBN|nr:uncharacterized protein LOC102665676 [Glycine max]XP_028196911.1 uncharacterized protein LOC114381886 [Glycine soja]KAH1100012.1 hypothetical protein GYH30_035256 [Glycine max]KAH1215649.1 hypothetical protein GmHk_13G036736 [Glycine max]KHN07140.1 hypothetical protein glysoja_032001 [Glycine soja]KRH18397.1 hypothetical protein GLYMA_13G057000v4 [Glycine max]RZB71052.1 hypothetical protein D0Y65_035827 [Glycine soja]|eukprot:XP_006593691.1 uncharacterized protein LOC102665676 [Glycine max]
MTTITRHSYKLSLKRATKRITRRRRRNPHNHRKRSTSTTIDPFKPKCSNNNKVCEKLETLKNLIPGGEEAVKPDQLFKETAEYIVLLRTRVVVLQKLIEYYGNKDDTQDENEHDAVLFS